MAFRLKKLIPLFALLLLLQTLCSWAQASNQICQIPGAPTLTSLQWNLCNQGQPFRINTERMGQIGVPGADIQITKAWAIADSSPYITVAVIDSGFDLNHPDLADVFLRKKQKNFLDPSENISAPNSVMGAHGNIISGIIGANGRNEFGITGVSKEVRILPIQAIPQGNKNEVDAIVAEAIVYAVDSGAQIINCSFGKYSYTPVLEQAVEYAQKKNVLIVASAGNDSRDLSQNNSHWPSSFSSSYSNVISVAATDRTDHLWPRSNFGLVVDIAAPGDEILSTGWYSADSFTHYFSGSGTSTAAPHVSATAALMLQANGSLSPGEIKNILLASADPLQSLSGKVRSGRLNSFTALKKAKEGYESARQLNRCDFKPQKKTPQPGRRGHSAFWELPNSPVLFSEIFYSSNSQWNEFTAWIDSRTTLSAWENLYLGLSIVKKAQQDFDPQEPIFKQLQRMAYNYQEIHDGVGKIRKTNCLESLLFQELSTVVPLTKDRSEFFAFVFEKNGTLKILGTFFATDSAGSSASEEAEMEASKLRQSGWQLAAHIHNHPFRFDASEEIAGHLSPSQVDLSYYDKLAPQKALITNGLQTIELTKFDLQQLKAF